MRLRQLCMVLWSPDDAEGAAPAPTGDKQESKADAKPSGPDPLREALKEVAALRKERDVYKAQADKYRSHAQESERRKIAEQLVDPKYVAFLPSLDFDDDGKPTEKAAKDLDAFKAEYPELWRTADAGHDATKTPDPKEAKKGPVPPAKGTARNQAYWDELKTTNPNKWRDPATQREYADWCAAKRRQ